MRTNASVAQGLLLTSPTVTTDTPSFSFLPSACWIKIIGRGMSYWSPGIDSSRFPLHALCLHGFPNTTCFQVTCRGRKGKHSFLLPNLAEFTQIREVKYSYLRLQSSGLLQARFNLKLVKILYNPFGLCSLSVTSQIGYKHLFYCHFLGSEDTGCNPGQHFICHHF